MRAPRRAPPRPRRASRRIVYLTALGAAAVLAAILIGISLVGGRSGGGPSGGPAGGVAAPVAGASETAALLGGIPQRGTVLGSPSAPLKLVEYVDMQCPYCARWATEVFPTIVDEYVRPGKLQVEFRGLAFLGPDSTTTLRTALAAADQNRLWNVAELLFRNQGAENSGWATDVLLRGTLAAVPGLDTSRVLAAREGANVTKLLEGAAAEARASGIDGTPSFQVSRLRGPLQRVDITSLDATSFLDALKSMLNG